MNVPLIGTVAAGAPILADENVENYFPIPAELLPNARNRSMYLDNSHTIEIEADGLLIRMSNEIKPLLLKMLMDTLKESLC